MREPTAREPVVLTIAGSDSSGGAGVQADLKTATALGVYAASVLTAVTAQNTRGVQRVHAVPPDVVADQLASVLDDLDVRAVKIGMLGAPEMVETVARALAPLGVPVVLDPVMVATSGDRLVPEEAVAAIGELLVPLAALVTPNVPEAELLAGVRVVDSDTQAAAGRALVQRGARAALIKGGHLDDDPLVDVLVTDSDTTRLTYPRVTTANTHGTGCTLSSAIATRLALGEDLADAVARGGDFLHRALRSGSTRRYGGGHGPVDHLVGLR